jgi:hypothetical protein
MHDHSLSHEEATFAASHRLSLKGPVTPNPRLGWSGGSFTTCRHGCFPHPGSAWAVRHSRAAED